MASVSQALDSLLPSQIHPAKLTSLANSLLAQSRLRAPNLKPEEEIARPYACADIACSRLRVQLRLPASVKGRPPCKPAVYKKLIGFLEGVLVAQKKETVEPASTTPTKRTVNGAVKVPASTTTTSASTSKRKHVFAGNVEIGHRGETNGEVPEWIMPLIRQLCKAFMTPAMAPHVYTGVCIVLKLADLWPRRLNNEAGPADELKKTCSALSIAIYLLVLTRMQLGDMTTNAYTQRCEKAVEIAGLGDSTAGRRRVEEWIQRLDREGWCSGQDWWTSVPEGVMDVRDVVDGAHDRDVAGEEDDLVARRSRNGRQTQDPLHEDEDDPDGVLLPGLGTMMQDAVDWLSEERRLEYLTFKEIMLNRIKLIERDSGSTVTIR